MLRWSAATTILAYAITLAVTASPASAQTSSQTPGQAWAGWYAGLNAGGTWSNDPLNTSASNSDFCPQPSCNYALDFANASIEGATGRFPAKTGGFIGGAQLGYNWLLANGWIAGFETDVQGLADSRASTSGTSSAAVSVLTDVAVGTDLSVTKSIDFLGTVRGRLGYQVMPTLLIFGTGGFAYGHVTSSTTISQHLIGSGLGVLEPSFGTNSSLSKMRAGWTLGGGFEWMFAPNWSAKGEYLYYDLGSVSYGSQIGDRIRGASALTGTYYFLNDVRTTTRFDGSIVRAGLNYHF